jgi:hypothetical protein
MNNKTTQIKQLIKNGEHDKALHIIAKFRICYNGADIDAIKTASDSIKHPQFYKSIGHDIELNINKGKQELIKFM